VARTERTMEDSAHQGRVPIPYEGGGVRGLGTRKHGEICVRRGIARRGALRLPCTRTKEPSGPGLAHPNKVADRSSNGSFGPSIR
jgi:hypothetical protein